MSHLFPSYCIVYCLTIPKHNMLSSLIFLVCGIWTQEEVPEGFKFSAEKNIVLDIYNITVHPYFAQGQAGTEMGLCYPTLILKNLSCDESRKKRSTFLEQAFYFRKFSSAQKYCIVVEIFVKILILSRFMLRRRLEYILLYSAISTARGFFPGWLIFYLNTRKFSPCPLCPAHPGQ